MKQSLPSTKSSSTSNSKSKKNAKEREKRKSQGAASEANNHSSEKGSPTKDSTARQYAGIDSESLSLYTEQSTFDHLSEEITNTLTEDLNYRLRYVINDALLKARLSGRNAICCSDLEQTFENLNIDKVYGAPTYPNWLSFGKENLYYLDDNKVNILDIVKRDDVYTQPNETVVTTRWMPDLQISRVLKNYFITICKMIVSNDAADRQIALKDLESNSRIGPVAEWFYNFGFTLLSKDITYDCLTLRALDLIRVLESSPICRMNAPEKQLKLLVRLLLQRLLKSPSTKQILKPMCSILAVLCQRPPLREFVISKVFQKLPVLCPSSKHSIIVIINCLGPEAVQQIFLPNMDLFLADLTEADIIYSILELYNIICKEDLIDATVYKAFNEIFEQKLVLFYKPSHHVEAPVKEESNLVNVKCALLRTRRKIEATRNKGQKIRIEEVFEMPNENSPLRLKIERHRYNGVIRNESHVHVGKTSLLLPVLKKKLRSKELGKCCHHLWQNI